MKQVKEDPSAATNEPTNLNVKNSLPKNTVNSLTDYFILDEIFPEANSIFDPKIKTADEIINKCIVVLDTNALLLPYNIGHESFKEIEKIYRALNEEKRIYVPVRAVKEFASNRGNKLGELYKALLDFKSKKPEYTLPKYPLLEDLEEHKNIIELQKQIKVLYQEYMKNLDSMIDYVKKNAWNDYVSRLYAEIFQNALIEPGISKEQLIEDSNRRNKYNIPPGFKDKSKDDGGIGDLIIWHSILNLGSKEKNHLIFVTQEEKNDWFQKSSGKPLYTRFELVDEYRRASDGMTFCAMPLSILLELLNVNEKAVKEIKNEEKIENIDYPEIRSNNEEVIDTADALKFYVNSSAVFNGIRELVDRQKEILVKIAHPKGFRSVMNSLLLEYNQEYRHKVNDLKDKLLFYLNIPDDAFRRDLYHNLYESIMTFERIEQIADDLETLTIRFFERYYMGNI